MPADIYDTLELSALRYGGIGRLHVRDVRRWPCCLIGHRGNSGIPWSADADELYPTVYENDGAVYRINVVRGSPRNARVSWAAYCAELNIQRDES